MHGDFTRNTFDPTKHYSRVLMQQGRVTLDADWNEQTSILLYYLRTFVRDVFGPHAGPAANLGFEIIGNLVDPALENKLATLVLGDRHDEIKQAILDGDVLIGRGRYYVDGLLVENHSPILYSEQPGYPFSEDTKREYLKNAGGLLLYLDVWERHVTYLQDDHIREVALCGPDTCSRAQVVWQLKVLHQPNNSAKFDCDSLDVLLATKAGAMRAQVSSQESPSNLCVISPESRYRGAENQLYRVEVHRSGQVTNNESSTATFKWSRDNGSVVFPIRTLKGNTATLQNLGRDRSSTLNSGDWVEIVDEEIAARGSPGLLAQVDKPPDRDNLMVTLKVPGNAPLTSYNDKDDRRPMFRRWDQRGDFKKFNGALAITTKPNTPEGLYGWIDLEDGVQVWFSPDGYYSAGDYWLIPARTATGKVEWPDETGEAGVPAALAPHGPKHHYAPILLSLPPSSGPATGRRNQDCRCRIERLPCGYRYGFGGQGIGPNF